MAVAVAIVLAIEFIVFLLVADEITQGEAVMRGDEVDSCLGRASVGAEDFARPGKPLRQLSDACSVRQPEGADVIAEAVVPFAPARKKAAEVVTIRSDIPGLGDQLDALQQRVLPERGKKGTVAGECGGEIEAEAVDVHDVNPVAQRIPHQLQNAWVGEIQGVAAAAEVLVTR